MEGLSEEMAKLTPEQQAPENINVFRSFVIPVVETMFKELKHEPTKEQFIEANANLQDLLDELQNRGTQEIAADTLAELTYASVANVLKSDKNSPYYEAEKSE